MCWLKVIIITAQSRGTGRDGGGYVVTTAWVINLFINIYKVTMKFQICEFFFFYIKSYQNVILTYPYAECIFSIEFKLNKSNKLYLYQYVERKESIRISQSDTISNKII